MIEFQAVRLQTARLQTARLQTIRLQTENIFPSVFALTSAKRLGLYKNLGHNIPPYRPRARLTNEDWQLEVFTASNITMCYIKQYTAVSSEVLTSIFGNSGVKHRRCRAPWPYGAGPSHPSGPSYVS